MPTKRAQVILEEWQHEWLAEEAGRRSMSLSALLRQLLTEAIERQQVQSREGDPLWGIVGIASGPDGGVNSENLDQFLYRADWREQASKVSEDDPLYR